MIPDIPPGADALLLADAAVPSCVLGPGDAGAGIVRVDIRIEHGVIRGVEPARAHPPSEAVVDLGGAITLPCFADLHTHLDKTQTADRAAVGDGTLEGALASIAADRAAHWTPEDLHRRMSFGMASAYAHGTRALRTHLDSDGGGAAASWDVFIDLRRAWAGRVELQAVSLVTTGHLRDRAAMDMLARAVAEAGGIFGAALFMAPDIDARIDDLFAIAGAHGLALDLHLDETQDSAADALARIARAALRRRFRAPIVAGHCCSLALQPEEVASRTLDLAAEAGIAVVSLPASNLYLQDRAPGRTPRWRGLTLLHEMRRRGIEVAVASDNCRDPFCPFGDHDMLDACRLAALAGHLAPVAADWAAMACTVPAKVMGHTGGVIAPGFPADLILFPARSASELLARPQDGRVVLHRGRPIGSMPPDFRTLDLPPERTAA